MNDIKVPPFTDGLKEIIEATEKHKEKCDKIRTNVNKWGRKNICDVDDDIDVLTNEEWLHTMNAEQLAEFLVMIQMSVMHPVKRGAVDMEKFTEEVVVWLKQPHTEKE